MRFHHGRVSNHEDIEWVGGLLRPPFYVTDREEPYRPQLAVWIEVPSGVVVGQEIVPPEQAPGALGHALRRALEQPMIGPPRRPDRVRIADPSLAPEVHEILGSRVLVEVAPTPELDALLESMITDFSQDPEEGSEPSYLGDGRIPPEAVESMFRAAKLLYRIKPWKKARNEEPLRLDIPSLGVEGACVIIIGTLGESFGFLIFPSHAGHESFLDACEQRERGQNPGDLGTDWLVLEYVRGAELNGTMRREAAKHGWPVAGPEAYPVPQHWDRDRAIRPLSTRDLAILGACAGSLSSFLVQTGSILSAEEFEPVSVSYFDEDDVEVRFTYPYDAYEEFTPASRVPASGVKPRPKVSRNAPCPCGSGLKYKKCHLSGDEADQVRTGGYERLREFEAGVVGDLIEFAVRQFRKKWLAFRKDFRSPDETIDLTAPWSVYGFHVDGRTVADAYLETEGKRCPAEVRDWLATQRAAWLSVWEVLSAEPGKSMTLRDLLSGESRCVTDISGSRNAVIGQAILARVVDAPGVSMLCGVHMRPLGPLAAAEVVQKARGRLRLRREVPVDRLREEAFGRYLIRRWEKAVERVDIQSLIPPVLHNTDGDPFLATTDRFDLVPGARTEIQEILSALKGVDVDDDDPQEMVFAFIRRASRNAGGLDTVLVGRGRLRRNTLTLETNSRKRADDLRRRVERACGDRLRYVGRVHADPLSSEASGDGKSEPPAPPTPAMNRLLRDHKERHYADWVDHPLPALAGQTPREAVRTRRGREAVFALLKEMEYLERQAGEAAYDFSGIRDELGIL